MSNILDRLIGMISPDAGLRRHRSRELLKRAYEGASKADGWRPKRAGASANADHAADAATLRVRSRALEQNVPYIAQGIRAHSANIIGTGIMPRWLGDNAKQHSDAWMEWAPFADADGRFDINGLINLAHQTAQRDGEVLIRIRPRKASDGLPVPVQFQVLEIDWLDDSRTGFIDGLSVINGIAYDVLGKVAGYYLFDQHPGETVSRPVRRASSRFIPARAIIHYFQPGRPGQGRGFPRVAPVIARVRDTSLYEDAELHRKNLETRLGVIASGDVEAMASGSDGVPVVTGATSMGELPSGSMMQVPTGSNITVVEPKAAPGYVEYMKLNLHLIAAGAGWTYEMMTGDVREVSFSSARIRLLDYRREAEQEQWLFVIPMLVAPIVRAFADAAELAGKVRRASYNVRYATPKWEYVNPKDDVASDLDEVFGGLSTLSEKMRRRGYEPDEVFAEWEQDFGRLRDAGMLDVLLMLQKGRQISDGAAPASQGSKPAAAQK